MNDTEKRIVSWYQLQARAPVGDAARALGIKEHVVRYTLAKLERAGILHPVALINLAHVGYMEFGAYFSLRHTNAQKQEAIVRYLLEEHDVPWFSQLGGDFQFALALRKPYLVDVTDFFDCLSSRFDADVYDLSIHIRSSVRFTPFWFDNVPKQTNTALAIGDTRPTTSVDENDRNIMHLLERDASQSHRTIARILGISQSTVSERIHRLESRGIISGYMYGLHYARFGYSMYELFIYMNRNDAALREAFHTFAKKISNIMHSVDGIGTWQFELGVAVVHAEAVHAIVNQLYEAFSEQITKVTIVPILKYYKVSLRPLDVLQ